MNLPIHEQIEVLQTHNSVLRDALADTKAELAQARRALANPAFADAAALGTRHPAPLGVGEASTMGTFASKAQALAVYNKIEDPRARAEFRAQHKEILGL